jgi:type VI protein secretion system component VasK
MGPGETIAALAAAGVLIALLCVLCSVFVRWVSYKQRKMELEAEARGAARQMHKDDYVELLEERVRVLERIATDRGQDIAHQIESLRDRQTAENI